MGTRTRKRRKQPAAQPAEMRDDVVPRLLRRRGGAHYLNVSLAQFDLLRAQGEIVPVAMPGRNGVRIRTPLFDKVILDAAIDRWQNGSAR